MSSLAWIDFGEAERQRAPGSSMALFQGAARPATNWGWRDPGFIADHPVSGHGHDPDAPALYAVSCLALSGAGETSPKAQLSAPGADVTPDPACRRLESRRRVQRHHRPRCGTTAPAAARSIGRGWARGASRFSGLARQPVRRLARPRPFARPQQRTPGPAPDARCLEPALPQPPNDLLERAVFPPDYGRGAVSHRPPVATNRRRCSIAGA